MSVRDGMEATSVASNGTGASGGEAGVVSSPDRDGGALDGLAAGGTWLQDLGLSLDEVTGTRMVAHIELGPQHRTPWGVIHGGVYATIVESVGSIGVSVAVRDRGQFAVGVHNSTDFIRSMTEGRVDILGTPVQQGRVQQLWDVIITRADGQLVAQGRLRLQNIPRPDSAP